MFNQNVTPFDTELSVAYGRPSQRTFVLSRGGWMVLSTNCEETMLDHLRGIDPDTWDAYVLTADIKGKLHQELIADWLFDDQYQSMLDSTAVREDATESRYAHNWTTGTWTAIQ